MNKEVEIIICTSCAGKGVKVREERVSLYDTEYNHIECYMCKGSGRLVKTTIIEPFESA